MTETVTPERLDELKGILSKIPGASRKQWELQILDEKGHIIRRINIRTGQSFAGRKAKKAQIDTPKK